MAGFDPQWMLFGSDTGGLGTAVRTLEEAGVTGGTLRLASFRSDGADLTFGHFPADFRGAVLPAVGEVVTILRRGTPAFVGVCSKVRRWVQGSAGRAQATIDGPMDHLSHLQFLVLGGGETGVYPTATVRNVVIGRPTATRSTVLEKICTCTRATSGSAVALYGTVSSPALTNDFFVRVVANPTPAAVLSDHLGAFADEVQWWDYSAGRWDLKVAGRSTWAEVDTAALGASSMEFRPRSDLLESEHVTFWEKYSVAEADVLATGGTGTASTRPGYGDPHTFTRSAGDSNWFSWVSGGGGGRNLRFWYYPWDEIWALYSTGQSVWGLGVYASTAAIQAHVAAKYWLPWEGSATFLLESPGSLSLGGRRIISTNGPAEWASMEAPVSGHTIDLATGRETVSCAPPYGYTWPTALYEVSDKLRS